MRRVLASFVGDIEQAPSKYSAINVNGVKAYKLARQDVDFTLPVRHVTIHDLRLLSFDGRRGTFAVTCSKGTYVRSLIRDLGQALGTCACMTYLVRTQAGLFTIDEAATLEELERDPMAYVRPADMAIQDLKKASCSAKQCAFLLQGRPVPFAGPHLADGDVLRVYGPDQRLMGIARYDGEHHILRPHKMFAEGL